MLWIFLDWMIYMMVVAPLAFTLTTEEAQNVIQNYLLSINKVEQKTSPLCELNTCCNVTTTNACTINTFIKDQSTLVLPGGNTRCIFSDSTPFAFQVIPGVSNKLLFYFQGGGGCWNEKTTSPLFCTTDVEAQEPVGIFDRSNPKNYYQDFTIVHVLYCSGDAHGGNVTRPYNDKQNQPVKQLGLVNVQSALDWVKEQASNSLLASTLDELVVMGCSAGSLGAQLWAQEILRQLSWKTAAIVPDSFAGVLPEDVVGSIIYDYGYCSCGFLNDDIYNKCINKELTVLDLGLSFMNEHPTVPYTFIEAKIDQVQLAYYVAVVATTNSTASPAFSQSDFYNGVNEIFGEYNAARKNFVTYLIDGDHHCYTQQALYYETDTKGPNDNGGSTSTQLLVDWLNRLPLQENESVSSLCDGPVQYLSQPENAKDDTDNTYCSSNVIPKEFIEHY